MVRIVLGVIAGFVAWSIVWVGSDQVLIQTLDWYRDHQLMFEKALVNKEAFLPNVTILGMNIGRSIIISILAGFFAAFVANENKWSTLILGVLLLAFGTMVEILAWNYLPIWYHVVFLLLLIPMTIVGGKLKSVGPSPKTA